MYYGRRPVPFCGLTTRRYLRSFRRILVRIRWIQPYGGAAVVARPFRRRFDTTVESCKRTPWGHVERRRIHSMLSSRGSIKDLLESATRRTTKRRRHVLCAVEQRSIVRAGRKHADFKGPLEDVFKRQIKRLEFGITVSMNVSIGGSSARGCKGEFLPTALSRIF